MGLEGKLRVSWTILRDLPYPQLQRHPTAWGWGGIHPQAWPSWYPAHVSYLGPGWGPSVTSWGLRLPIPGCSWASPPSTPSLRRKQEWNYEVGEVPLDNHAALRSSPAFPHEQISFPELGSART